MMVGIGIGTELSLNGTAAYAFAHILYKSLLFMATGAVLYRTGTIKATDLGGVYRSMPLTAFFCAIGALSISTPLTGGFVSKSMVLDAVAHEHLGFVWLTLLFASAGVFLCSGIKIVYFAFFSRDAGHRVEEAPASMLVALGIAALSCIFLGSFPKAFYAILPYPVDFEPYTIPHVVSQLQLLLFSALAFALLLLSGIYPAEIRAINLDADLIYRKGGRLFYTTVAAGLNGLNRVTEKVFIGGLIGGLSKLARHGPANFLLFFIEPYWKLIGLEGRERDEVRDKLYQQIEAGVLPVGLMGFFAMIYFGLLFLL